MFESPQLVRTLHFHNIELVDIPIISIRIKTHIHSTMVALETSSIMHETGSGCKYKQASGTHSDKGGLPQSQGDVDLIDVSRGQVAAEGPALKL